MMKKPMKVEIQIPIQFSPINLPPLPNLNHKKERDFSRSFKHLYRLLWKSFYRKADIIENTVYLYSL